METYASARAVGFRFGFRPDFLTSFVLLAGRVGLEGSASVGSVRFRVGVRSVSVSGPSKSMTRLVVGTWLPEAPNAVARFGASDSAEDGRG